MFSERLTVIHANLIVQLQVGVDCRVETGEVAGGVGVAETCGDGLLAYVASELTGDGLPLPGGGLQAQVAVGGDAYTVHEQADSTLMPFGINVVEGHHVNAVVAEIPFFAKRKLLGHEGKAPEGQKGEKR